VDKTSWTELAGSGVRTAISGVDTRRAARKALAKSVVVRITVISSLLAK
jgi:hypothetical protein